jgi:predicted nucleic acid-binding protein
MIFVDTGYLLALLTPRDHLYQRAQAWSQAVAEPLVVTDFVLWEMVNGLSMPMDRPKAHQAVAEIRSASDFELIPASDQLFDAGPRLHREREDKEWSLTDCISFFVMQDRSIRSALTYDHHFEQAGFEALLRRDPP